MTPCTPVTHIYPFSRRRIASAMTFNAMSMLMALMPTPRTLTRSAFEKFLSVGSGVLETGDDMDNLEPGALNIDVHGIYDARNVVVKRQGFAPDIPVSL